MTTVTASSVARYSGMRQSARYVHLTVRALYALAGVAALAAAYLRFDHLLQDPIVSAILTLILMMVFTVVAAPRVRRS